ncbi:MAG: hypothetical protein ACOH5I_26495 [Oligoflexus sp.]
MTVENSVDVTPDVDVSAEPAEAIVDDADITTDPTGLASDEPEDFETWLARQETNGDASDDNDGDSNDDAEAPEEEPEEPQPKIWKLKVHGKEVEFDASDEAAVQREVQKGLASQQAFTEAKAIKSQAENFVRMLRENPRAILEHPSLGINVRELAEEYLYEQLQRETDPEGYKTQQEQRELEQYRQERQRQQEEAQRQQKEAVKAQQRGKFQQQILDTLSQHQLPATDWTVSRMSQYMAAAMKNGYKDVTPSDVAERVKADWQAAQRQLLDNIPDDKLEETLGKATADRLRRANLAKNQKPTKFAANKPATARSNNNKTPQKSKYGTVEQMMETLLR